MADWANVNAILAPFGGAVVLAGVIVTAAFGLFKLLGEKWLDAKFSEKLQVLEHRHQKELEELKIKYVRLTDRATRLNQREFDAIPECWALMQDAYLRTETFIRKGQSYADLSKMNPSHLDAF
ncbi:hypothetical protein [Methylocapsa palsarum]|uniref:Uncharacterized protein n=1 Tax=Methylocapsa palsarum TaxID=1612308 RepID=A0A1I4C630_9HYPH|nr:hypothetical protein [Methylocapsa palsarum]SFK76395.1 hypothetical protein SAMN05444581_11865 [Methylocapsa palsarum]